MSCTCNSKSFLHTATCESVHKRLSGVFGEMINISNVLNNQIIFYIAKDIDKLFDEFMNELGPNFAYAIGNARAATVSLGISSEITFLNEVDSIDLLFMPKSNVIYIEKSDTSDETIEQLKGHTEKFVLVNPASREAM